MKIDFVLFDDEYFNGKKLGKRYFISGVFSEYQKRKIEKALKK